jgi:hypothetical protein
MSEHYDHYPVLLAEHELGTGSAVDRATRALEAELEARGLRVVMARPWTTRSSRWRPTPV